MNWLAAITPIPRRPPGQESIFIKNNAHDQRRGIRREIREYQDKNGERFWVEFSINPVKEKARVKYYLSTWLDITERKKAEKALQESEAFTSNILETAPNPIVVTKPDGSVFYVNPAAEKLTGYSRDELVGRGYPYPWWPSGACPHRNRIFFPGKLRKPGWIMPGSSTKPDNISGYQPSSNRFIWMEKSSISSETGWT